MGIDVSRNFRGFLSLIYYAVLDNLGHKGQFEIVYRYQLHKEKYKSCIIGYYDIDIAVEVELNITAGCFAIKITRNLDMEKVLGRFVYKNAHEFMKRAGGDVMWVLRGGGKTAVRDVKHFKDSLDGLPVCGIPTWEGTGGEAANAGEACRDCLAVIARRAVQSIKIPGFDIKFGGYV